MCRVLASASAAAAGVVAGGGGAGAGAGVNTPPLIILTKTLHTFRVSLPQSLPRM